MDDQLKAQITDLIRNQSTIVNPTQFHRHTGGDGSPQLAVLYSSQYDPAAIKQQIVGTTANQTLSNKTLTSPVINTATMKATVQTVSVMGSTAVDGTVGNVFTRTLAASETFTQTGFVTGQCFMISVKQGSGTSYTVTWFGGITWVTSGGTAPVQTTVSNGITIYGFRVTGTNTFEGLLMATN